MQKTPYVQSCLGSFDLCPSGVLHLRDHGEEYVFTFPSAFARSIITVPWVELGGKVTISCAQTGYSASVTFHTKPFYGGKVHRSVLHSCCVGKIGFTTCSW